MHDPHITVHCRN